MNSVQVIDAGQVPVGGSHHPSHGLYRPEDGGQRRVFDDIRAPWFTP